ncbi:MAG: phosphoglucosamine mutase [Bryobacterales bacterium]|nr:phosphoglucosamine mutase [Bryobacterales bacterium]
MARREHNLKIGVSGIRGVVGDFLTPGLAAAFAQAFATYVGAGRVVLGRDTRGSGPMIEHAVACGLMASGCEVVRVGVLPTPTIQIYVGATGARGGIAVTASHNPPEYNALKLFNVEGLFFNHYERAELLDIYHQSVFTQAENAQIQGQRDESGAAPRVHLDRVLRHVDAEAIRRANFRVALDAVNGAGAVLTPGFLREDLGCDLRAIAIDPTQPFPREAEPRPDTLGDLSRLVAESGAVIGFGQDPDGDRLAVADETGRVLDNDDVLALVTDAVLARTPGNVVVNLTTSSVIDDVATWHGCRVFRTPVGEANVVETMLAVDAVIGGEGSNGGIIFPGVHLCRDSYTGMAFLLARLVETGLKVSALAARLPRYYRRAGKAPFAHGRLGAVLPRLEEHFTAAAADRSDGLKLSFEDGWVHLRASNTEPLLRVAVESRTESRADALYREVMELLG